MAPAHYFNYMIRIRRQLVKLGRKTSVEIITVDQYTSFARSIDRTKSELIHLKELLSVTVGTPHQIDDFCFWLEKE